MAICKNMFAVLFVLATINMCLAKPRWIWQRDEILDGFNDRRVDEFQDEKEVKRGCKTWSGYGCPSTQST